MAKQKRRKGLVFFDKRMKRAMNGFFQPVKKALKSKKFTRGY